MKIKTSNIGMKKSLFKDRLAEKFVVNKKSHNFNFRRKKKKISEDFYRNPGRGPANNGIIFKCALSFIELLERYHNLD